MNTAINLYTQMDISYKKLVRNAWWQATHTPLVFFKEVNISYDAKEHMVLIKFTTFKRRITMTYNLLTDYYVILSDPTRC